VIVREQVVIASSDYAAYLQSEEWRRKRDARLAIDTYRCRLCDSQDDLEVHHRPSSYPRIPNESITDDLTTLCRTCHEPVTDRIRRQRYAANYLPLLSAVGQTDDSVTISSTLVLSSIEPPHESYTPRSSQDVLETPAIEVPRLSAAGHAQRPVVGSA
jgi:hypothetical protein